MNNPIVDELRKIRDEHAKKFNYDIHAMFDDIRKHQANSGHPVVSLKKRPMAVAEQPSEYKVKKNS
jgi:hypothetical protein